MTRRDMSDKCPKCGAEIASQHGIHDDWKCGSDGWDGVVCQQSDKCRIAEQEQETARLRDQYQSALNFLEQAKAENARLREDAARLDWLDSQKSEHHANWDSPPTDPDGEGGGPAFWRDPGVCGCGGCLFLLGGP